MQTHRKNVYFINISIKQVIYNTLDWSPMGAGRETQVENGDKCK